MDTRLRVQCWRVAAESIPRESEARVEWLESEWRKVGDWVQAQARFETGEEYAP